VFGGKAGSIVAHEFATLSERGKPHGGRRFQPATWLRLPTKAIYVGKVDREIRRASWQSCLGRGESWGRQWTECCCYRCSQNIETFALVRWGGLAARGALRAPLATRLPRACKRAVKHRLTTGAQDFICPAVHSECCGAIFCEH